VSAGLEGGCACGAVRYRLQSAPFDAGYCHCERCRRASGAPALAFATVPLEDFVVTRGAIAHWRSTSFGQRGFCRGCGTQLTMQVEHQPGTIDFTICSLEDPDAIAPGFHLFFESRPAWFDVRDALPRHARLRADTRGLPGGELPKR
jgi:hypothetical protein